MIGKFVAPLGLTNRCGNIRKKRAVCGENKADYVGVKKSPKLPLLLLVDDNPDDAAHFRRLLDKAGVPNPVATVEDGEQAISYLRKSCQAGGSPRGCKPALIFLDVKMPRVGGFEVLKWIRHKRAFRKTKVIMMTSSDEPKDMQRAADLHADGYLLKLPSPRTLAYLIQQATSPNPPISNPTAPQNQDAPAAGQSPVHAKNEAR